MVGAKKFKMLDMEPGKTNVTGIKGGDVKTRVNYGGPGKDYMIKSKSKRDGAAVKGKTKGKIV